MTRELLEKMARAHWEDNRQSYGSMITWEDATERDRCAARDSMAVAVALLSDPANITDEMVAACQKARQAAYSGITGTHLLSKDFREAERAGIAAAFSERAPSDLTKGPKP